VKKKRYLIIDLAYHLQEPIPKWNKPMELFYNAIHITAKGSFQRWFTWNPRGGCDA
jgi:hypothetical protein